MRVRDGLGRQEPGQDPDRRRTGVTAHDVDLRGSPRASIQALQARVGNRALSRLLADADAPGPAFARVGRSLRDPELVKGRAGRRVIQLLRWKSGAPINIGALSLARALDLLGRPNPDPDVGGVDFEDEATEREALRARVGQVAPLALAALRARQVGAADLAVLAQRNVQVTGADQQTLIDFMELMAQQGAVRGFAEWLGNVDVNPDAQSRQDHMNELWEGARLLLMGAVPQIDLSEAAIPGTAAGQTADVTLGGGEQVEVKTVRAPITRSSDLRGQLEAGLAKFDGATSGNNRVSIYASVDAVLLAGGHVSRRKNQRTTVTADPNTVRITTARARDDTGDPIGVPQVDDVVAYVQGLLNAGAAPGIARVRRVAVIMENTRSFELTKQADDTWTAAWL